MIEINKIRHTYGERVALDDVTFRVGKGDVFALLGPNGGGKTTLFRLLSTAFVPQSGHIRIAGLDVAKEVARVREKIGVVFQKPSLDAKLTVLENLQHQGHLYGLRGALLRERIDESLSLVSVRDRQSDFVSTLSGGLQRRVELAKALLHRPEVLIFDEPSTGLDPGARRNFWDNLMTLRETHKTTLILTTHFMDEAEKCDQVGILDGGKLIALDSPIVLKQSVGNDVIAVQTGDTAEVVNRVRTLFDGNVQVVDNTVRIACAGAEHLLADLYPLVRELVTALTLSQPSLEDVFVQRTGHNFDVGDGDV
ncbi:MAG: ATP-binding cassette domain-containing protein [bacterium]|jgi:ABC-2 type transport system ATP-binding protein|nr:ATP-binding cassette domain-containing protein [bacterium]